MMTDRAFEDLIEVVRETARREIMPCFRRLAESDIAVKTGPHDLVTKADLAAEESLTRELAKVFPDAMMIGEEAIAKNPAHLDAITQSDLTIIIDPIDGTGNFAHGLAIFGVIVAVVSNGKTVFGLLYDPVMDDWVRAEPDTGAWHSDTTGAAVRLSTSSATSLDGARGLVPLNACQMGQRAGMLGRFDRAGQIQDLGCSCHEYRLLASGQSDFLVSIGLNPWDHAAGQLVIAEAGGWSTVKGHGAYSALLRDGRMVAAGRPQLGQAVADIFFAEA